ncbi:O-methyltransferase [Brevibacillus laterosporus]|uniref:tRNA 5-hydroxyuridine methyltransferase n=1 Tax=Brevibacillus laterosporus LMG 15441 TaxID=1042163 RepID=A0A075R7U6_BRELA|nr:O-methyltransferase [Brevibacillus laterosporus]AIG25655.1 protein-L-isoaspartate O-methyltransferase [Brevibacillus laterosporus LMG 15441]RJL08052.1 O-methyltransferase [Brevibacillus laterosporus]TPH11394.1 O-methyltransferase [Brevibacillus laterosporus]
MITNPAIDHYLQNLIPQRSPLLTRLEQEAHEENVPIIQLTGAQFLRTLLLIKRPKSILEVGTAIGYSTIWLAEAAPTAKIVTMELDEERITRARASFKEASLEDRIELIEGDATKGLSGSYEFDCLFIDAAKGQYLTFLQLYLPLLKEGGLVITDNVLYRGLVTDPQAAGKRQKKMVEKIDRFNKHLMGHPQLETSIVPIGDGIAVSVKQTRGEGNA